MPSTQSPENKIASILQAALVRLRQQNPAVSQRSLASHLGLSSSFVSKVFRGERRVPAHLLGRLAKYLQLDHHELSELQSLLLKELEARTLAPVTGIRTLGRLESKLNDEYALLGKDDFWLLEKWYYLPLLNLVSTDGFVADSDLIGQRLNLSATEVKAALGRLENGGYLQTTSTGSLERTQQKFRFPTQRSHESVRNFHRAMITRALPELAAVPSDKDFAERLISGITFTGDPSRVPEAKLVIEEALYRAAEMLAGGSCSEVFQINLQLFKLTR